MCVSDCELCPFLQHHDYMSSICVYVCPGMCLSHHFLLWWLTPHLHSHLWTLQQLSLWGPGAPLAPEGVCGCDRRPAMAVWSWAELTGLEEPGLKRGGVPHLCLLGIRNDTQPQQMPLDLQKTICEYRFKGGSERVAADFPFSSESSEQKWKSWTWLKITHTTLFFQGPLGRHFP